MNCKRHPSQDCPGVCAACLRDRLLDLLGAHKPEPSPPPCLFPGSSSAARRPCRLFFSTPQVGPAAPGGGDGGSSGFSLISLLFRHKRSEEEDMGSGSWLRALIRGGRRTKEKKPRPLPEKKTWPAAQRRTVEKGLSPAAEESDCGSDSGYSTASSGARRMPTQSPMRREEAAARRHQNERGRVSGFGVCWSPLVRASPGRRRSKPAEVGFSGDPRSGLNQQQHRHHHHHLRHASGGGAAFATSRSRKLADVGRFC